MAQIMMSPAAGQRTKLGNTSLAGSHDDPEINRPNAETQTQNPTALIAARLELLREFAHEQYSAVERQALIAQWSLEDGDEAGVGLLCTYTGHSWGARNALVALIPEYRMRGQKSYPVVQLSSKARNNSCGTIDPVFKVLSWTPAEAFAAITGDMVEAPALAATESKVEPPRKLTLSQIIDDGDIPFAWMAALPIATLIAGTLA